MLWRRAKTDVILENIIKNGSIMHLDAHNFSHTAKPGVLSEEMGPNLATHVSPRCSPHSSPCTISSLRLRPGQLFLLHLCPPSQALRLSRRVVSPDAQGAAMNVENVGELSMTISAAQQPE